MCENAHFQILLVSDISLIWDTTFHKNVHKNPLPSEMEVDFCGEIFPVSPWSDTNHSKTQIFPKNMQISINIFYFESYKMSIENLLGLKT